MEQSVAKIIYLDVIPEKVYVSETYTYHVTVAGSSDTKPKSSQGEVQVEIPYDGFQYFSRDSAHKACELIGTQSTPVYGQIGWLALSNPHYWEQDRRRHPGIIKTPIRIPLHQDGMTNEELWVADKYRAVLRQEYETQQLKFWPISMKLDIYDDNTSMSDSLEKYLESLQTKDPLEGGVIFNLIIQVSIPQVLAHKDVHIQLDQINLKWPSIVSKEQLFIQSYQLSEDDKVHLYFPDWRYDPDTGAVQLKNVEFIDQPQKMGSPIIPYECTLQMWVGFPGELIGKKHLEGDLVVSVDNLLLSGRELAWFDSAGEKLDQQRELVGFRQWSDLQASFEIFLEDQLARKHTASYRCWTFPGVELNQERFWDVAEALRDLGYQILEKTATTEPVKDETSSPRPRFIDAKRKGNQLNGDPVELFQYVRLRWQKGADTRRERQIPDGLLVSTELQTSDLVVDIFGKMDGPGNLLDEDLEQLMVILQQRLAAVADLR